MGELGGWCRLRHAAGLTTLVFGAPLLLLSVAGLALAFVAARSLALLSGAFVGVGGTWLVLLIRGELACEAFDAAPNQGCQSGGVAPFLVASAIVLILGLPLGALAWRRRAAQRRPTGSASSVAPRPR
jgi:hypothetical protein